MSEHAGWLFDLYAHPQKGIVLWLVGEDGRPQCFHQDFEMVFYAAGPAPRLRELWRHLRESPAKADKVTRDDLFDGPQDVMRIRYLHAARYQTFFRNLSQRFPDLTYYDVDIPLTVRYAAASGVFLMAHCQVIAEPGGKLVSIQALDKPEDIDVKLPRLRILSLQPDADPARTSPKHLIIRFGKSFLHLPFDRPRELLTILSATLAAYDPDVIQTHRGDDWLFPHLLELSEETGIPFNPNRDISMPVLKKKEVSFFNYGRAHYRAPQVHLRGRWHIDVENGMTYNAYHLSGAIEQTRMSSLPLQEVARRSPGACIAAMQTLTAMRRGVLIPYQTQKSEIRKTYNQLVRADRGGLVFQPKPGLYQSVAILDFSSMMPSIMIQFNVSPETVGVEEDGAFEVPELGLMISRHLGLMPETLQPMRDKRLELKRLLRLLPKGDPRSRRIRDRYKPVVDALKWLSVVAYGRLGFANSTFGRINAHETVSYLSRKIIMQARAVAESMGFEVLHLYVDSLFVSKPGASQDDFQRLAQAIQASTNMPMDFDGTIFPWFAFLSTRDKSYLGVANRFYGLAPNGEHKVRGLMLRRSDTPLFVANLQMEVLQVLARESDPEKLWSLLPMVVAMVRDRLAALKKGEIPLEQLTICRTLSRELEDYSVLTPLSAAARQLQVQGKTIRRGQRIRYIHVGSGPGVYAWGLHPPPNPKTVNVPKYRELILRAVEEALQPLGVTQSMLEGWLLDGLAIPAAPDPLTRSRGAPLLSEVAPWELIMSNSISNSKTVLSL